LAALPLLLTCRGSRKTWECHPSHLASFVYLFLQGFILMILLLRSRPWLCVTRNHCNRSPLGGLLVPPPPQAGACDHPRSFRIQPWHVLSGSRSRFKFETFRNSDSGGKASNSMQFLIYWHFTYATSHLRISCHVMLYMFKLRLPWLATCNVAGARHSCTVHIQH
jgi:hypothetical protein